MLSRIWNDKIKESDYDLIFQHIKKFPKGHMIAEHHNKPVATSVAFPIERKPVIDEFSSKHPYDFFSINGRYYYIHVIQVLPEYRNQGIGTALLNRQITVAKERKCDFAGGFSLDKEIKTWEKSRFKTVGEFGEYKNFGKVKWIEMELI